MRKIVVITILLSILLVLFACSYNEGVVMSEKPAYLQFLGDASGVEITLDGNRLVTEGYGDNINKNLFQYQPGYYELAMHRSGSLILKQIVLLENGKTTQVVIP